MRYDYFCDGLCDGTKFSLECPTFEPAQEPECPRCCGTETRRDYGGQQFMVKGERQNNYAPEIQALNPKEGTGVSAAQNRRADAQMVEAKRRMVNEQRRSRRTSKKKDGEMRYIGSTPEALHRAVVLNEGRDAWSEPKKKLKEHGLLLDPD